MNLITKINQIITNRKKTQYEKYLQLPVVDYNKVGADYCTEHGFNLDASCDVCLNIESKELYPLWDERKDTEGEVNKEWYTFDQLTFAERNAYCIGRRNSKSDKKVVDYKKEASQLYPDGYNDPAAMSLLRAAHIRARQMSDTNCKVKELIEWMDEWLEENEYSSFAPVFKNIKEKANNLIQQ